jgi:hypothetical protein
MILCENFCTGARRAADVVRTAAPGSLAAVASDLPSGVAPPQGLVARGPWAGCRAGPGNPHPGQGCCEAGKRQVRGHHRIVVIRRTGTTQDGTAAAHARGVRRRYQGRPVTVALAVPGLIDRGDLVAALDRAALLADILDVLHGASPAASEQPGCRRRRSSARASCGCCGTCRPTCPGPRSPASPAVA